MKPHDTNTERLPVLSHIAPVTTVAAVAKIAESATIRVVAHASSTNSSCMNLAKYMFSTIHAICPIRPKNNRQNQIFPPSGVVFAAPESALLLPTIFSPSERF